MACKKCNNNKCGCNDSAITMPATFSNDPSECPSTSETCSEVFDLACICYGGPDIVELDIQTGDRMDEILQKLVIGITNNACATFDDDTTCASPLNLTITSITSSSFAISWDAVPTAVDYTVEYKLAASPGYTSNTSVVAPIVSDTVIGLTPNSVYDIRVLADCDGSSCYSLVIRVQTLPS